MGRGEVDEKQLLSELSRFFTTAKTAMKAAKNARQNRKKTEETKTKESKPVAKKSKSAQKKAAAKEAAEKKKEKMAKRKTNNGGTIRVTFKGGYSVLNRGVPGTVDEKGEIKRAAFRAKKSALNSKKHAVLVAKDEKDHQAALSQARADREAEIEEARVQAAEERAAARAAAEEAGEEYEEEEEDEEVPADIEDEDLDVPYTERQSRAPVGTIFSNLVKATGGEVVPMAPTEVEGVDSAAVSDDFFFAARENPSTKCIVKIKGAKNMKATGTLATTKSVNYFKTNFGQLIKKELQSATSSANAPAASSGKNEGGKKKKK